MTAGVMNSPMSRHLLWMKKQIVIEGPKIGRFTWDLDPELADRLELYAKQFEGETSGRDPHLEQIENVVAKVLRICHGALFSGPYTHEILIDLDNALSRSAQKALRKVKRKQSRD